jgi:hypothetical protein
MTCALKSTFARCFANHFFGERAKRATFRTAPQPAGRLMSARLANVTRGGFGHEILYIIALYMMYIILLNVKEILHQIC